MKKLVSVPLTNFSNSFIPDILLERVNIMEKVFSAAPYFYGVSETSFNSFRVRIRMKDPVDPAIFRKALDDTMERYPYFLTTVRYMDNQYVLVDDPAPIVVRSGTLEPIVLGSEEAAGHYIAFCHSGNVFCLDGFHGICDGAGIWPMIQTLLYYYCTERYQETYSSQGIRLKESPISPLEYNDPYPQQVDDRIQPIGRYQSRPAFQLAQGEKKTPDQHCIYHINIDEGKFIRFCKENDSSPSTLVALLLARAIDRVHPNAELPIICGLAMNVRPVLKCGDNYHSLVSQLFLEYKDIIRSMPLPQQGTAYRGMVILQSQPENVWTSIKHNIQFANRINQLPGLTAQRQFMAQVIERAKISASYKVSYVGQLSMGEMAKHIESMDSMVSIDGCGIMAELNACSGLMQISFSQEFSSDVYLKAFVQELEDVGLDCSVSGPEPLAISKVVFSDDK